MRTTQILALALFLLPAACKMPSEQRVPLPDQSLTVSRSDWTRIYFVRDDDTVVQNLPVRVTDQETEIGKLTEDTYLCWERPAGRTLGRVWYDAIDPSRGKLEGIVDLNCSAGRAFYFNVRIGKEDGRPIVTELGAEEGRQLVASRKPAGKP